MNKYTVVNTGLYPLPFSVINQKGVTMATYVSEVRAERAALAIVEMEKKYDRD
jgi:hypothetical protein